MPAEIQQAVTTRVSPVVMTRGLKQTKDGTFGRITIEAALSLSENATVVAFGPVIGQNEEVAAFVREFVIRCPVPLVLDADALTFLSQEPSRGALVIKAPKSSVLNSKLSTIWTPHPAEMGRLLGTGTKSVQQDRLASVKLAAVTYDCIVLLKGARSWVASSDGTVYLNQTGNLGLSTGGSGDALTGLIAGLLGQSLGPLQAAFVGAYLHGLVGDLVEIEYGGSTGKIATDLISSLLKSISRCQNLAANCFNFYPD